MSNDNVAMFRNPQHDWLEQQARESFITLATDMAQLRIDLEELSKEQLLAFRAKMGGISNLNLDGYRALTAMLEILGGVMATKPEFKAKPTPNNGNDIPPAA